MTRVVDLRELDISQEKCRLFRRNRTRFDKCRGGVSDDEEKQFEFGKDHLEYRRVVFTMLSNNVLSELRVI